MRTLLLMLSFLLGGCASHPTPADYRDPEYRFWPLLTRDGQREILSGRFDRDRLREKLGPPTIDDGEEWVYVGKFENTKSLDAGRMMSVAASLDDPVWKTAVVTFDRDGLVEAIRVGTTDSAVAERQKQGIFFGRHYDRPGRVRAATRPTSRPSGVGH